MRTRRIGDGSGLALRPAPAGLAPPATHSAGSPPGASLWLALDFPALALDALSRGGDADDGVVVVVDGDGGNASVLGCSAVAARAGVCAGMRCTAAYTLCPTLRVLVREPETEARVLAGLAAWAGQFSSQVSLQPPATLLIEIGGSLRLFGGLPALLERVDAGLAALGYAWRRGVAPTPAAAWLLARAGEAAPVLERSALAAALAPLPITCLPVNLRCLAALRGMGVRSIGDCLRLPRDGLSRRLGTQLLDVLDRALARRADARVSYRPPARFRRSVDLWDDISNRDALLRIAERLLIELCGLLRSLDSGVQQLELRLSHRGVPASRVRLGLLQPSREAAHLLALLTERLQLLELPAPTVQVEMRAGQFLPMTPRSFALFAGGDEEAEDTARLLERLRARLGRDAVHGLGMVAAHAPERAWRVCEPGERTSVEFYCTRPLWLLDEPSALTVREGRPVYGGGLRLLDGPERLESGWWEDGDIRRDYYVASNDGGQRLWIFRELREPHGWYLHGLFD